MDEYELSLIKRAKAGDELAIEKLIVKYTPRMHELVQKYSMFGSNYEDLLQEVKAKFVEAIKLFDPDKSKLITFITIIINYTLARQAKHESRLKRGGNKTTVTFDSQAFIALEETSRTSAPFYQFQHIELIETCDRTLNRVETDVLQAAADGYTYREIAEQSNRTYNRITGIKQNVQKKLKTALSHEPDEE